VFVVLTPALERAAKAAGNPHPATRLLATAIATALLSTNVVLAVFKRAATISRRQIPAMNQK
jgi:hypothetical protein